MVLGKHRSRTFAKCPINIALALALRAIVAALAA